MPIKTFVLDTNVLLHDPNALLKFGQHDVVIPIGVLQELDKKKRFSDELGKNARQVIRFITSLEGSLHKGVLLSSGGTFSIYSEKQVVDKNNFSFSIDNNKHQVLLTAYNLQQQGRNVVVLISKDFVLRVKAESLGLRAEHYESISESFDNLYLGMKKQSVTKQEFDAFCTQGVFKDIKTDYFPNEYCHFNSPENASAIGKFNPKKKQLEILSSYPDGVWGVKPLNEEQQCAFDLLLNDDISLVTLVGQAGTGKTLIALTCALTKVFDETQYNRILVSRPIMPLGKDIGYLPGTKEEKIFHWMQPIYDNLEFICENTSGVGNGNETKKWIMDSEKIEMEAVTYIRGRSLAKTFIIIDEAQNLSPHEMKTIISRAGKGTKVVLTGDPTQIDNPYLDKDSNALTYVVGKFKTYGLYGHMVFNKTERSDLAALAAKIL